MINHPEYPPFAVTECKQVKLAPDERPAVANDLWFTTACATTRFCEVHRQTKLVLAGEESGFSPVYPEFWPRGERPQPTPGEFTFRAVFYCPLCRLAYALCPPEFHDTTFDAFDASTPERAATLARAREFAAQVNQHNCGFALFVGPPGQGKTRLACNIIRELNNHDALYVRLGKLTCELRAAYGRKDVVFHRSPRRDDDDEAGDDNPPTQLEIVQNKRFLVLDEIGCTALANDERLFLDELLKHRYEHRKPTILISNLPLTGTPDVPGMKEFLGDALTDRIKEASGNGKFIVQFASGSYRRTTGEAYLGGLTCHA
ncbi:MAG: ATP-binding protein [Verrucomicrobiia bacterium]